MNICCSNRCVFSQIVCRCGIIFARPIIVHAARGHALRRGYVIGCISRSICHPLGADHRAGCADDIRHLRIHGQLAARPGNDVSIRHIFSAACQHEARLIDKARCVNARLRAACARARAGYGQPGDAGGNTGDALNGSVIVRCRAICRQRQRHFFRPDRIQCQIGAWHDDAAARCICRVGRRRGGIRAPAKEVIPALHERIRIHAEARAHRLRRAVARVSANRSAVAVIGQGKERHLRVDHDCVVFQNAADGIAVARVRRGGHQNSVVRNTCDFVSSRKHPVHGHVRAVYIRTGAALCRHACCRCGGNAYIECLVFPDGVERSGRTNHAHTQQYAVIRIIPGSCSGRCRIPTHEYFAGIQKTVPLHRMVGVVHRSAGKRRCATGCCAAVSIIGNRNVNRRIHPDRGQRCVRRDRDCTLGIVDFTVDARTPANEYFIRRRRYQRGSIRLDLRLTSGRIPHGIRRCGSGRFTEAVADRIAQRADPDRIQHHILVDLHTRIE